MNSQNSDNHLAVAHKLKSLVFEDPTSIILLSTETTSLFLRLLLPTDYHHNDYWETEKPSIMDYAFALQDYLSVFLLCRNDPLYELVLSLCWTFGCLYYEQLITVAGVLALFGLYVCAKHRNSESSTVEMLKPSEKIRRLNDIMRQASEVQDSLPAKSNVLPNDFRFTGMQFLLCSMLWVAVQIYVPMRYQVMVVGNVFILFNWLQSIYDALPVDYVLDKARKTFAKKKIIKKIEFGFPVDSRKVVEADHRDQEDYEFESAFSSNQLELAEQVEAQRRSAIESILHLEERERYWAGLGWAKFFIPDIDPSFPCAYRLYLDNETPSDYWFETMDEVKKYAEVNEFEFLEDEWSELGDWEYSNMFWKTGGFKEKSLRSFTRRRLLTRKVCVTKE
ncbi:hypothetical protein MP638_005614 [Amoeboaphelidium occidentale]|nr:hypothetical protein MP638_005614 [Amoeboaphelidium occidentale]